MKGMIGWRTGAALAACALLAASCGNSTGDPIELDEGVSVSGVMLQAFTWESASRTNKAKQNKWYGIVSKQASEIGRNFEYVWLPPPSSSEGSSPEGYFPMEWNVLDSKYGTEEELKSLIALMKPAKAIADIVVNHRNGYMSWGQFARPSLCGQGHDDCYAAGCDVYTAIAGDDEGFTSPNSPMYKSAKKGAADTGEKYAACRDLDHTNPLVRQGIINWMNDVLKPAGFVGWRYDYVKGYGGKYVGLYNAESDAAFSVGEYWPTAGFSQSNPSAWGNEIKRWIQSTSEEGGQSSRAFDFALKGILNTVFGSNAQNVRNSNYKLLADGASLMQSEPNYAVTFVDNHDTGSTQKHWYLDPADVGTAYAFILTHPGVPCVAWQHYFSDAESGGYGDSQHIGDSVVPGTALTYREHIGYLIALRNRCGIKSGSGIEVLEAKPSLYAAKVSGGNAAVVVAIGDSPASYDAPEGFEPLYSGTNWQIWTDGGFERTEQ